MKADASLDRDANRATFQSNESFRVANAWTFVTGTTGAVGQHTLFTVTGDVIVNVFGICNTDLTSGGAATISVGSVGNVAGIVAATTATDIDDGDIWVDATPGVQLEALPQRGFVVNDGQDITIDILVAAITGGAIDFYCLWRPLESTGLVTATTPA